MQLPESLRNAIEAGGTNFSVHELHGARENLSARYRTRSSEGALITSDAERQAYVAARMPATYAAVCACLRAIKERLPELQIKSVLDLGAGPGTAMWASVEYFSEIESFTSVERDRSLAMIGKKLAEFGTHPSFHSVDRRSEDLERPCEWSPQDLVIFSYSLGELNPDCADALLQRALDAASQLLLIVEPGTPVGFERIGAARESLLRKGAYPVAPCPHSLACPMTGGDWCHFSARVERTSLHRRLKGGTLGYEDEKFSYIAVSKFPVPLPEARVLCRPERHSGHVKLKLCTSEGVTYPVISKRAGPLYKEVRKIDGGDSFSPGRERHESNE